jgi:hypothetical protein
VRCQLPPPQDNRHGSSQPQALRARQGDKTGAREAYQRAIDSDFDIGKLEADLKTSWLSELMSSRFTLR